MKFHKSIEGVAALMKQFKGLAKKIGPKAPSVQVGYTQDYAVRVHEDLEMRHPNGGQAKFLEEPARRLNNDGTLGRIVQRSLRRGDPLALALMEAGLKVQAESQKLVPVDTGALKASAFTALKK